MAKAKRRARRLVEGTAETIEAPGVLRRYIRFAKLASGHGADANKIENVASLLDKNNLDSVKEVQKAARAAIKGFSGDQLKGAWRTLLQKWERAGVFEGKETALAQLKKLDPAAIVRAGANQTSSALSRATGPLRVTVERMYKAATPLLPGKVAEDIGKSVAGAGAAAAEAAPEAAGLGKKLLGKVGGKLGAGLGALFLGFELKKDIGILNREKRAKQLAMTGYQGLGPASSADYLRNIVQQQEMIARRKTVMQQFEPELFQDVVRVLADTGPSKSTLTSTEREIGANAQMGVVNRGRSPDDVKFLLDQLFSQMGGGSQGNGII
jgi:hypothetical protein